jgi:hypothetical protein
MSNEGTSRVGRWWNSATDKADEAWNVVGEKWNGMSTDEKLLAVGLVAVPLAIGAAAAAAPTAVGAGAAATVSVIARLAFPAARAIGSGLRWSFTGTRVVSGTLAAAPNATLQMYTHRLDYERYNWGSLGFDYVVGATGYLFAKAIITRYPARLLSREILTRGAWLNFTKQQALFALDATIVGALRSVASNTPGSKTAAAANAENVMTLLRSQALQNFVFSPTGKQMFPRGYGDPRVALLNGVLSYAQNLGVRAFFGVIPSSGEATTPAPNGGR